MIVSSAGNHPGKLWSLWDMLERLNLEDVWESAAEFVDSYSTVSMAQAEVGDAGRELTVEEKATMKDRLTGLKSLCEKLSLSASAQLIGYKLSELPTGVGEMNMLWLAVKADMASKLFLFVPDHLAKHYERDDTLHEAARQSFPQANQELRDAGNCLAAGLDTACVFQCMRALEYGLGALAADVGVKVESQNWQNVIDQIDKAIRSLGPTLVAGVSKSDRLQFLSEAANEFRHFKDAWRNHVSHNKVRYTETQATKIMVHVTDFIETISLHLKESP